MKDNPKILVARFSSLGDVILATAILPNLKARWPGSHVAVLTKGAYAPVFDNNPFVDRVMSFDSRERGYPRLAQQIREASFDVIIDLQGNARSWLLRMVAGPPYSVVVEKSSLARRSVVWFKRVPRSLRVSVREKILECLKPLDAPVVSADTQLYPPAADPVLQGFGIERSAALIGIAPGAKHRTKQWPAERFAEAANRLGAMPNAKVVVLGDISDQAVAQEVAGKITVPVVNLTGRTSLPELFAVVSRLSLLLTNDSGIMHAAEALKIPLVALFGPTVRAFGFAPYRPTSRVVEVVNLPCRPCTLHGDDACPLRHHNCMNDIDLNAVLYTASSLIP